MSAKSSSIIGYEKHSNDLLNSAPDIPKDQEVIVTCGVGYRGNIAASFLQSEGFAHVHSLAGGMSAWINSGGAAI